MNDYKRLLGDIGDLLIAHPSENVSKMYLRKAADAIEQLVKERDAAVKDLKEWCDELCYCEVCKHNGKCSKEFCKFANNWEWRGVQE